MSQTPFLFTFSAKSIQSFVLDGGKLGEMIGATHLIDRLPGDGIKEALKALEIPDRDYEIITSAAGAARIEFRFEEHVSRVAAVWPMIVAHMAPGLEMVQAHVPITAHGYMDAVERTEKLLAAERQRPLRRLPELGPLVARNPRTGLAAVQRSAENDLLDAGARAKLRTRNQLRRGTAVPEMFRDVFGFETSRQIPDDFSDVAGDDRGYIGVLHADGNSLGQLFITLGEFFSERKVADHVIKQTYKNLSAAIKTATRQAAKEAMDELRRLKMFNEKAPWPVVPIVLAGDDLTVVLRADLSLPFAEKFLVSFEKRTEEELRSVSHALCQCSALPASPLPEYLTAGAGIALVKHKYPFKSAYELSESLASFAKSEAKRMAKCEGPAAHPASSVAFHRVSSSTAFGDFREICKRELTNPANQFCLSAAPYFVGKKIPQGKPSLDRLNAAVAAASELPKGSLRELASLLLVDSARAIKHFERVIEVADHHHAAAQGKKGGTLFREALDALTGVPAPGRDEERLRPLGEILTALYFSAKREAAIAAAARSQAQD